MQAPNQQSTQTASTLLTSLNLPPTPITSHELSLSDHTVSVLHFECLPSTMLLSHNWPEHLMAPDHSWCFLADKQSQGQGQHTNTWSSPKGNVYMTVLTVLSELDLVGLSMVVALSVAQTVEKEKAGIKWMNDVVVGEKKLSGALVRTSTMAEGEDFRVEIGIGLNVKVAPLPGTTCLEELGESGSVEEVAHRLLKRLTENLTILKKEGCGSLLGPIKQRLLYLGEHVLMYNADLTETLGEGVFTELSPEFHATIRTKSGELVTFSNGRMRRKPL